MEFLLASHPVVERFLLPERSPRAAQDPICHAAGSTFEPSHDGGHWGMRLEDRVDVVGHDRPRMELVKVANRFSIKKSVRNYRGDSRILQPEGTRTCLKRTRTGQAPRHKDCGLVRKPMREVSSGKGHKKTDHRKRWSVLLVSGGPGVSLRNVLR